MSVAEPVGIHTTDEAAAILRVKPSWLERQAAARRIPFTMLGGSYRFSDRHLAEIIRLNEVTPGRSSKAASGAARPGQNKKRKNQRREDDPAGTVTPLRARPRPRRA